MENLFNQKHLDAIGKTLIRKKQSIAIAESVTAGLLQYSFSNVPGAAKFFQGGLTAYNLGQKYKHLKVEPLHAQAVNCVSPQVAKEMALHVSENYSSDWGVGITGYCTPVPEGGNKLVAYFCIIHRGKTKRSGVLKAKKGDPQEIQLFYVNEVNRVLATLI